MGPERPQTNVAEPIWASFEPYQVTEVQDICCFRKWGRSRTDPIPDRKWGRSRADPILLSSLIGLANRNSIEDSTLKRATCGPTISLGFHNHSETRNCRSGTLILNEDPRRVRDILREACTEGNALDIFFVYMAPTHRSQGNLRGGVCRGISAAPVVGHPRPTWRQVGGRGRHGPLTALFGGARSGRALCHSDWGSLTAASGGEGAWTVEPGWQGLGSVPFGGGWPPSHRASVAGARSSAA